MLTGNAWLPVVVWLQFATQTVRHQQIFYCMLPLRLVCSTLLHILIAVIELCVGEIKGEKCTLNCIKYTLSWPTVLHRPQRVLYCAAKSALCNSCIMYPSDLPDTYISGVICLIFLICTPNWVLGPQAWVYISGKSRGHAIQLICTM